ncbi:endou [Symbiodinium sp. CCMP2592]|nr:endou [Symbiodinium sp. CCMP2592]
MADVAPPGGPYQAPPVQPTDMPTAPTVRTATPTPANPVQQLAQRVSIVWFKIRRRHRK